MLFHICGGTMVRLSYAEFCSSGLKMMYTPLFYMWLENCGAASLLLCYATATQQSASW